MKKKICIFTGYFPLQQGGAEYQAYLLAESLKKDGYDIFFIMFSNIKKNFINKDGYKIYSITPNKILGKFGRPFFLYYFKIKEILAKEKPDIVYRRMGEAIPGLLALQKKKLKFKLIWSCAHIRNLNRFKIHYPLKPFDYIDDFFRIYGIKKTDQIIVQTNDQKQLLMENFHRDSILIPNLHPKPNESIEKKEFPIQIVWVANYKQWKQPEIFIDLAEELQNYFQARFIMIGRVNLKKSQQKNDIKINKLKNLDHLGELSIEAVNKILSESHIFINTSLYEGFPNTFIQAWMRKVPVVSLNVDPDDILKEQGIGFHSGSYQQMVSDVRNLIVNKGLREEMGNKAQKYAFENHSLNNLKGIVKLITT